MNTLQKGLFGMAIILLPLCSISADYTSKKEATLIITNAKIFTSSKINQPTESLVVTGNKIVYSGDNKTALTHRSSDTKIIDLKGQVIIPGMIDAHAHPGYIDVEHYGEIDEDNKKDMLAAVKDYAEEHPDEEWLRICCWPTDMYVHGSLGPNKEELDAVVPDRPVWFASEAWHDSWLNSKALEVIGVDKNTKDPQPGLATYVTDENGELTGWVKEGAGWQHFIDQFGFSEGKHKKTHEQNIVDALQTLSENGITTLYDAGNFGFEDQVYNFISRLEKEGNLPVRYEGTYQIYTPERTAKAIPEMLRYRETYGGELLKFNTVKLFMDGINENHSGGMLKPYLDDTSYVARTMLSVD
ncbi:MAG: amidohydrolase family protein, partial [Flavobacteriales bacterium]|nr:amidohydrolase family protein [Flavobacteriales bacterium]